MTKKKVVKPQRKFTKRQLSHWQRQKKRQRITFILGITIIVVVIGIIIGGWFVGYFQPLHQTVIRVNDTEFNMKYYIEWLKFRGAGQSEEYVSFLSDVVVQTIEQNELIRQEALKLGISVSDDEVKEELKSAELDASDFHMDLMRGQMLINKLLDEYFEQQVPASAVQRHVMAMLLESEPQADEVRARLENGESFTGLAEEFSLHHMAKTNKGDFDWHPEDVLMEMFRDTSTTPAEYAFLFDTVGKLSQPLPDEEVYKGVSYWLIKVLAINEEAEEAHVQAMLLGSEEEAKDVRARLEAGEDFATLAKEVSRLTGVEEDGGDLGTVETDSKTPVFDEYVFGPELELGKLSEPIRDDTIETEGGCWLVKVLAEDDDRQITDDDRGLLKTRALEGWVDSLRFKVENEVDDSYLDAEKKAWAVEQATKK